jgi:hypothetical protein
MPALMPAPAGFDFAAVATAIIFLNSTASAAVATAETHCVFTCSSRCNFQRGK